MSKEVLPVRPSVFVVEDEPKLLSLLRDYLEHAGFATRTSADGDAVLPALAETPPDLLLLDVQLPGTDGFTLLRRIRASAATAALPVIVLTARVDEVDRLLGLELGADDYVLKPFSPREVVARVRAVLRRRLELPPRPPLAVLILDPATLQASYAGVTLALTPVEFRLLARLAGHPGATLSRAQLLRGLYPDHRVVSERTIDSHIRNLRRKLSAAAPDEDPIRGRYGQGYRWEGPAIG